MACYVLGHLLPSHAEEAYRFHAFWSAQDENIRDRSLGEIAAMALDGSLYGATRCSDGKLIGICYAILDGDEGAWEIGGLIVEPSCRDHDVAWILGGLALVSVLVFVRPWNKGRAIVAKVRVGNTSPVGLLSKLGFQPTELVTRDDRELQKYIFGNQGLNYVQRWFDSVRDRPNDEVVIKFDLLQGFSIDTLRTMIPSFNSLTVPVPGSAGAPPVPRQSLTYARGPGLVRSIERAVKRWFGR